MDAFRLDTKLTQDGTLTLNDLPFQAGDAVEVIIVPRAAAAPKQNARPLRGKVLHYDNPTAPVAQEDWEALQ
ncbi:MAG TPA: hypothetical protein VKK81_16825 [Candidatus Binatia bacterium]|nr:hypothetical protein [Candidatus Binatia bacterium]